MKLEFHGSEITPGSDCLALNPGWSLTLQTRGQASQQAWASAPALTVGNSEATDKTVGAEHLGSVDTQQRSPHLS